MKDIKDYLHLYLGANVEVKKKNDKNFIIGRISEVTRASNHGDWIKVRDWIKVQFEECYTTIDDTWHQSTSNAHYFFMSWDSIKLILRPLSDMTKEEAIEVAEIVIGSYDSVKWKAEKHILKNGDFAYWDVNKKHRGFSKSLCIDEKGEVDVYEDDGANKELTSYMQQHEVTIFLLSKGFDLFGLIEEGLAIVA